MNKEIYIVTGAAGFLGGNICRQLIDGGRHVRAFVLPGDKAVKYVPSEAEICEGNLTDPDSIERLFDVGDYTDIYVIHSASIVTLDPDYNVNVINVNVGGTENLVDACLRSEKFRKLVYVSSTGAIPELPKGQKITEVDHFDPESDPEHVRGCYSLSKALATQVVLDAVHERGLNACCVHPSGILGPGDYSMSTTTRALIQIINGEQPMGISGTFNLCDVRDLAYGTIAALEKGRSGECYILGNKEVTYSDFVKLVCEESGAKPVRFFLPTPVAAFLAGMMEKRAKKKGERPKLTTFSVYNLARNNDFDSSKAEAELGYHVRSYRETIRDECQWLLESGMVRNAS